MKRLKFIKTLGFSTALIIAGISPISGSNNEPKFILKNGKYILPKGNYVCNKPLHEYINVKKPVIYVEGSKFLLDKFKKNSVFINGNFLGDNIYFCNNFIDVKK